jgi:hypothetical protein
MQIEVLKSQGVGKVNASRIWLQLHIGDANLRLKGVENLFRLAHRRRGANLKTVVLKQFFGEAKD